MRVSQFKKVMEDMSEIAKKNLARDKSLAMVCAGFNKQGRVTLFHLNFKTEEEKIVAFKNLKFFLKKHGLNEFLIIGEVWFYEEKTGKDRRSYEERLKQGGFIPAHNHPNRVEAIHIQGFKDEYIYQIFIPFVRTVSGIEFKEPRKTITNKKDWRGQLLEILTN